MASRGNNLDVAKEKHEIISICPQDLAKVYSSEGVLSRSFHVAELSSPNKIHVHLRTYVDHWGGYAEHGRNVLFGLQDSGRCCMKLTPIKSLIDTDPIVMQKCSWFINNPAFEIDKSIYLCIAGPGWAQKQFLPENRYKIMWTMIESQKCNPEIFEWLKNVDETWCPTSVDLKRMNDVKNRRLMRLGYDHNLYNPFVKPIDIPCLRGRYVFGVLGSWNKRKGIKKIIGAFCKAFNSSDNVSLLLVSKYATRPYEGVKDGEDVKIEDKEKWTIEYEFKRYIQGFTRIPHITLIDIPIHENVLPHIMARFDCLVGFSMGESTWLPGLQAMGMKIPVIQLESDCSGFTDYMNTWNSYFCRDYKHQLADDELVKGTSEYYLMQHFADGNENELAEMMRKVYIERKGKVQVTKAEDAYDNVGDWIWERSIEKVVNRLGEIKRG